MYSFGTDEYITQTVERYSPSLLRAAYSVLHSTADAQDAVQETFLKLMTKRPHFKDTQHEKAWLLRVVINISRNMQKSAARRCQPMDENTPCPPDRSRELLDTVLALPERYSTVIHLYYYEGYSIKEIAAILNLPSATVGTRLARARALLRPLVKGDDPQ